MSIFDSISCIISFHMKFPLLQTIYHLLIHDICLFVVFHMKIVASVQTKKMHVHISFAHKSEACNGAHKKACNHLGLL